MARSSDEMPKSGKNDRSVRRRSWLGFVLLPSIAAIVASIATYYAVSAYVMSEAEENVQNILLSHRGVHDYIQQVMHPAYFRARDVGKIPRNYYSPEILSSSFVVRVMHDFHNEERIKAGLPPVYYKLASNNPRNPVNQADAFESSLIRRFNEQRDLTKFRSVITIDGKKYLYYAIPFLETNNACIRCHGDRSDAPSGLQDIYSGSGGFNEQTGGIRAIESIRAPIAHEMHIVAIVVTSVSVFLIVCVILLLFNKRLSMEVTNRTADLKEEIDERIKIDNQMEILTQRLQLATSSAHLGVWDWNIRDNTMVWDDRMFELYGISRDSFPSTLDAWTNGLHPEDRERAIADCQAALHGEKDFDTFFRVSHPDGTVKHIKANGIVIRGADGSAERMIGINADITEQVNAEAEKARLEGQLLQAQKMESVGRLAGGVAHDFNNMLGVILGHAELGLLRMDSVHPVRKDLQEIRKAAEHSAELTRQLLAFARKQSIEPKVLDLNETVAGMLKMLQRLIGEDVHLAWLPAPEVWPVRVDPSQVDQILANLCVNARDAIEGTGRITIETRNCTIDADHCAAQLDAEPGDYVRLTISDDGRGMDKATLGHIFEPFFTTKGVGKGTGLGLSTVYGAVKQNNGIINIYSEPGNGTTFSIYLPRHFGQNGETKAEEETMPAPCGNETILLVEDEQAILDLAATMLEKLGYCVLKAGSPDEAVNRANDYKGEIHALMTDVIMPGMNGKDLASALCSHRPNMKQLFMSGYTADVIVNHGMLGDEINYLQKPFTLLKLAVKVRQVLGGEAIPAP